MITKQQMQEWEFPVYVAFADNSGVHNSVKAIEVEKNIKPLPLKYGKMQRIRYQWNMRKN